MTAIEMIAALTALSPDTVVSAAMPEDEGGATWYHLVSLVPAKNGREVIIQLTEDIRRNGSYTAWDDVAISEEDSE